MRYTILTTVASIGLSAFDAPAQSNIDSTNKHAWQENAGWSTWRHGAPNPSDGAFIGGIGGNNVTDNDRGIDVDFSGNIIIKNTASGNGTNYDIAADNKVGVIVAAPNSMAISGSSGGAGVGTTDPWANFSF